MKLIQMNKSLKSFNEISFETNAQTVSAFQTSAKFAKVSLDVNKLQDINQWLQAQDISFPVELVPEKFTNGSLLCEIINNNTKAQLKYIKYPKTSNESKLNIRKALGYLRNFTTFRSNFIWNEDEIFYGKDCIVWGLLNDLKKFLPGNPKTSDRRSKSVMKKSAEVPKGTSEQLLKDLISKVKPWLYSLELSDLLKPCNNFIKDPVRNGVLLCNVVNIIEPSIEFCQFPECIEDVYNNIQIAVNRVSSRVPIKKLEYYYYTEPQEIWSLLFTLMMFYPEVYPKKPKPSWPYTGSLIDQLKVSLISWVNKLNVSSEDFTDFKSLAQGLKTGELLGQIVKKIYGKDVIGIQKNPKTEKVCLSNLQKSLDILQRDKKVSQQYLRDPKKIYEVNLDYIMLLLEDLHRMQAGLPPRKRGISYHSDGPFIQKSIEKDKSSLTPTRSYSSLGYSNDFQQFKSKNTADTSFSRKLITNTSSAFDFYNPASIPKPKKENYQGFEWLKKLDLKLPEGLNLANDTIEEFCDGELLCKIISLVDMKDIQGVKKCKPYTPEARRNIKLAMDLLKKKPNLTSKALYIDENIWKGDGNSIRLVLSEIHKLYKIAIYTLIRFNRKNRVLSLI
jgi:Calponin homology (CH) domain